MIVLALSACTAGQHGPRDLPPNAGSPDTVDGAADTGESSGAGSTVPLAGRAKYEGTASGEYSSGGLTAAMRYFSATVSLIADFGDNTIGGLLSDGRDTATDEQIFAGLRLEPAAIPAGDTESFSDGVIGVVDGNLFTGNWSGQFTGEETASAGSRSSVGGTFEAQRIDHPSESVTGTFSGDYSGYTSRTVGAFNALPPTVRSRLVERIARAANRDAISTADAGDTVGADTGDAAWNTGVTQSSDNPGDRDAPAVVSWAINARHEDDELVFDQTNLSSPSPVTLTTSGEPVAPGYRSALALTGRLDWAGVEHLHIGESKTWNYSILISDIEDNEDADYVAGGLWASFPDLDNPAETRQPSFVVGAGGNDAFQGANIETLKGRATYQGDAFGLYVSRRQTPAFRYFNADVRLTADFSYNRVRGVVLDGRDTATDELLFAGLELDSAKIRTDGAAFFGSGMSGVVNGSNIYGRWGGHFLGNGASPTEVPASVAGTFGASDDSWLSLVGIFGAHEDLTRRLSGHGLGRGTFEVEPGDSKEYGNLAMSCPAGGSACALKVLADGTASYDTGGGVPTFVFALPDAPVVELDGTVHVGADVAPTGARLTAAGTRHGASVSTGQVGDGVGGDRVVAYLREHAGRHSTGLETFSVRPVVRVAEGTGAEFVEYTERAVRLINAALPYEKRILFSGNSAPPHTVLGDVPDGEIFVDFTPWEDWNDPGRRYGEARWSGRNVVERRAVHIWRDSESLRTAWEWNPITGRFERLVLAGRVEDTDTVFKAFSDDYVVRTVARLLLQGLGLVRAVDPASFPDSIMNLTDRQKRIIRLPDGRSASLNERIYVPGHILYPLDREALLAAYNRFQPGTLPEDLSPESLGTWGNTSFHIRGALHSGSGQVSFGVASRNGLAQPWASGPAPSSNLADNTALSGTGTWNGALLGMTRSGETVAGAARLAVDLTTLDGQLDFTNLERWGAEAAPGTAGTGTTWGDGDLGYSIRVDGNGFTETGGDHGEVTGVFFGTSHRGMGGVVERNDLAASFGGKR